MGIGVLGPLTLNGSVRIAPRDRVVLQALVVRVGEYVDAEVLADALWGEAPPASWPKIVQGCVSRLRKQLGPNLIETSPHGYRLVLEPDDLDVATFERLLMNAREHLDAGDADRAAYVIGEGLLLWRGQPLTDVEEWEPGRAEIARLQGLRMDAQELAVSAEIDRGRAGEALEEARVLVTAAPYREQRWALIARALYQVGRQSEALEVLHRARLKLRDDLGLDPGPDLMALQEAILRQDPDLARVASTAASEVCPYRGLLPYEAEDAEAFFGREGDVAACLSRLRERNVLVVVGPSGCGKSSLVRAGVVAALRRNGRRVVVTTPGSRPLDSLASLPRRGTSPVLVVDQAEEAVTLCQDTAERTAYFAALAAYDGPLVLALRADRLGDLSAYPDFARLVESGLYLLAGLTDENLRMAIQGPAEQAGLRLEGGLLDLLVREVEGEPGALPLLSHVLRLTWERREGSTLTVAGYQSTGGVRDALARSAESLYAGLDPRRREQLRALLLRLVMPTDDSEPVRTRVARNKVVTDRDHADLVESLITARLVTSGDGDLQIAHEALAREWPRLRDWLAEDVEGQRIFRHLATAAEWWDAHDRPETELYRGPRLAGAADWARRTRAELTPTERAFLEASVSLEESENRAAQRQLVEQQRANRRLRRLLVGVAALLVVALVASFLAARQTSRARDEAAAARKATRSADAHRVGLLSADEKDLSRSLVLALEANRLQDDAETRDRLSAALTREPRLLRSVALDDLGDVAVSADGARAVVTRPSGDPGALLVDTASGKVLAHNDDLFSQVAWPDPSTVAVGRNFGPGVAESPRALFLLDSSTLQPLAHQLGGQPSGNNLNNGLAVSTNGRYIAGVFSHVGPDGNIDRNQVLAWDRKRPDRPVFRLARYNVQLGGIEDSGRHVFVGTGGQRTITAYDLVTGRPDVTRAVRGASAPSLGVDALAPNQRHLAVTVDNDIVLLDPRTLREQRRLHDDEGSPLRPLFSGDSRMLAAGVSGANGGVTLWDSATGRRVTSVARFGQDDQQSETFSPDGQTLLTARTDGLDLWDLAREHGVLHALPAEHLGRSVGLAVDSPDGTRIAYVDSQGAAPGHFLTQVQDVASGRIIASFQSRKYDGVNDLQWFPDNNRIAVTEGTSVFIFDVAQRTGGTSPALGLGHLNSVGSWGAAHGVFALAADGTLAVLDEATLRVQRTFQGFDGRTTPAAARSGLMVLDVGKKRGVLLDPRSGHRRTLRIGSDRFPWGLSMSPDGRRLVVAIGDAGTGLFDVRRGRWISPPVQDYGYVRFSPDGDHYVTTGNGRVSVWDGHTGRYEGSVQLDAAYPSARFSHKAGHVVVTGETGGLLDWSYDIGTWRRTACHLAGRNLDRDEWRDLVGSRPYHRTCPEFAAG